MALLFLALLFLFTAICHFTDRKYGRNNDMEDTVRKRYRKWIGVGYLGLVLVSVGVFVAEFIYKMRLDSGKGLLCLCLAYMIPILYMLWINKRFHQGFWKK